MASENNTNKIDKEDRIEDLILKISGKANSILSLEQFLRETVKDIGEAIECTEVEIVGYALEDNSLVNVYRWKIDGQVEKITDMGDISSNKTDLWKGNLRFNSFMHVSNVEELSPESVDELFNSRGIKSLISCQLETENDMFGNLFIFEHRKHSKWSEEEIRIIKSVAGIISLIIENRQNERKVDALERNCWLAHEELKQRKHELALKNEVSLHLSDKDNVDEVMDEALSMLTESFRMEFGCLYISKDKRLHLKKAVGGCQEAYKETIKLKNGYERVEKGTGRNAPSIVNEILNNDEDCRNGSWISIPLSANCSYLGSILMGSSGPENLDSFDSRFLEVLGAQIGVYIQNTITSERLREYSMELDWKVHQRTMELEVLYELSTEIAHSLNYDKVLEVILNSICRIVDYDLAAYILIIDNQAKFITRVNSPVEEGTIDSFVETIRNKFLEISPENKETLPVKPTRETRGEFYEDDEASENQVIQSTFNVPIKMDQKVVGILNISSFKAEAFSTQHIQFLGTVALQASMSLTQLRQFLETRKTTFQTILENIKSGVILIDGNYYVKMTNPAGKNMLQNVAKIDSAEKITFLGNIPIKNFVDDIFWNRAEIKKEEITITDVTTHFYQITASPFKAGESRIIGVIIIIQDITEEKVANQQLMQIARMVSVGELAAGVAHEINNPLTGILGFSELLLERTDLTPDLQEIIRDIYSSGKRASQITEDLLHFARNQREPTKEVIDLVDVLDITLKLVVSQYKKLNINIVRDYPDSQLNIYGNSGKIQQAVLNLIGNAKDAMVGAKKGSRIIVSSWNEPDGSVVLRVRDDGPGIPRKIQERIFDPFFTTKEVGKGTGLGLSITYRIVDDHDGKIYMESEEGKYTQFKMIFPPPSPQVKAKVAIEPEKPPEVAEKLRILAIDDEAMILKFIQKYYKKLGYYVSTANSPQEGIGKVKEGTYDLVLLDFRMPGMNGEEMYDRIVEAKPELKDKIVMVTGDVMGEEVRTFLERTNVRYLLKPMDLKDLRRLVES